MKGNLEKLPTNTWIKCGAGDFYKDDEGVWLEMFPHCGDCTRAVAESETPFEKLVSYQPGITEPAKVEDLFGEYEIVAAPLGFVLEEPKDETEAEFSCLLCGEDVISQTPRDEKTPVFMIVWIHQKSNNIYCLGRDGLGPATPIEKKKKNGG